MSLLWCWLMLCIVMAVRETSDDVYDPDYSSRSIMLSFVINLAMWHYWFAVDLWGLWNARKQG